MIPAMTTAMTASALTGDFTAAAKLQRSLVDVVELMFCEVNPIPVKAILKQVGFDCGGTRLPLTPLSAANQKRIEAYFQ